MDMLDLENVESHRKFICVIGVAVTRLQRTVASSVKLLVK